MNKYQHSTTCQIANIDELFMKHFGYKTDGTFVEVGAHDGYSWSNTYGLANAGWFGIYFEPMKEQYEQCCVTHAANHGVHVYNCCVGNEIGETKLFLGENPTIDRDTVVKQPWCEYDENNFIIVPVVTLDAMLSNEEAIVADFDLLVIDVEGAELQVLEGINLEEWRPHMIIIETHDGNVDSRKSFHADAIKKHMSSQPYVQVQCDGLNTVYIRQV